MISATLLKEARRRAGLAQADLAGRARTTQSAIARLERGASHPSLERLVELVAACGFELRVGVREVGDSAELATLRRNLALSPDDRVRRATGTHRFIEAGRAAMARRA